MKKKKSIVIGITSLLLVTLILLGLTYAYYKTRIVGNSNDKSVSVVTEKLEVTYQNESAYINAEGIETGYTATKTFEVKNTGDDTGYYSVMLDSVENTFSRLDDWIYTLSENGTTLKTGNLSNSNIYILYNESISAGVTKSYTLKIEYKNLEDVDQSIDMGASLSFRINISDSLGTTLTSATEGTLLYAINRDNVVSEPLSTPGVEASYVEGTDNSTILTTTVESSHQGWYFVYGTGYTLDNETGLYTLTGVTTTSGTYSNSYSELVGKYVAYYYVGSISGATKTDASAQPTSSLEKIYKITNATSSNFTYQILSSVQSDTEAVLIPTEDEFGTSYVYRGSVADNYLEFNNMCWRIVRIEGDGSIKITLAAQKNCSQITSTDTGSSFIGTSDYGWKNVSTSAGLKVTVDYVGSTSGMRNSLNTWLTSSGIDTSKLKKDNWCIGNLRDAFDYSKTGTGSIIGTTSDMISSGTSFRYTAGIRRYITKTPTLICDVTGTSGEVDTSYIGTLTYDEIVFAGGNGGSNNTNYYLASNATSNFWWTLSPSYFYGSAAHSFGVNTDGRVGNSAGGVNIAYSVRPAITLASTIQITSGNGTIDNPYIVS